GASRGVALPLGAAVVLAAAAAALLAAGRVGDLEVSASPWGWPTLAINVLLATAAMLVRDAVARRWQSGVVAVGATVGAMAFTLYTLHVLWLALWVTTLFPGERDDTWVNVIGMSVVAVLLAVGWRALDLGGRWWRGPV